MKQINCFPRVLLNSEDSSCVNDMIQKTTYCLFVWHRRIGKCVPKLVITRIAAFWAAEQCSLVETGLNFHYVLVLTAVISSKPTHCDKLSKKYMQRSVRKCTFVAHLLKK